MAKYVSQTLSYCASESNKFTSSNARQSKRLNGERENIIEKKWVRQFYLTWKKFCLCDREIAQQKVINYETIARRKKAQDCVCIYCILVCYHMLQYTQSHIDFDHHPRRPIVSSNNFSFFPRQFFFLIILFIFIFPYISFAFSSTSLPLFTHGQLDDSKLIYDFFIISIDGINTMYIGFVLTLYEIKCITKNMDHIGSHK